MRPVRHPIAIFVLAVVAVIGIGVGVVAATTHPKLYGPSWGRFTATFPGRVIGYQKPSTVGSGLLGTTAGVFSYYVKSPNPKTGYAPLALTSELFSVGGEDVYGIVASATVIQLAVRSAKSFYFNAGVTVSLQDANGLSVTTVGPQCTDGECKEVLVVTNGRVVWDVHAFSKGPLSNVESFIGSFQPIG